jgi:RES domain-containing protein
MGRGGLMLLWRLSGKQYANSFDGGYGLLFDGRWNTIGHAVTYCATSPSLCVLEKLVHIEDPSLLPDLVMITYDVPEQIELLSIGLDELPKDWRLREGLTQQRGDAWHRSRSTLLLEAPSAIVPLKDSPDVNVLINHSHASVTDIKIVLTEPFALDQRLL